MVGLVMSEDRISMQQRRKEIINDLKLLPGNIMYEKIFKLLISKKKLFKQDEETGNELYYI